MTTSGPQRTKEMMVSRRVSIFLSLHWYCPYHVPAIHVEWCKAHACAHCWEEEVRLLFKEQQHTLRFLEWHASWWMDCTSTIITSDEALSKGCRAYAEHQANLWLQIQQLFAHMWRDTQNFLDFVDTCSVSLLS